MTKLLSFSLAALVASATLASAASPTAGSDGQVFFRGLGDAGNGGLVEWPRVDAPAAGVIEVREFRNGQVGRLIDTEAVDAGTNWRVRVNLGTTLPYDTIALLKVDGQVVGQSVIGERD